MEKFIKSFLPGKKAEQEQADEQPVIKEINSCEYDPTKPIPELVVENKIRDVRSLLFGNPEPLPKIELKDENPQYETTQLIQESKVLPIYHPPSIEARGLKLPFINKPYIEKTDIEFKYNLKILYDILRYYYKRIRYLLANEIKKNNPKYFTEDANNAIEQMKHYTQKDGNLNPAFSFLMEYYTFRDVANWDSLFRAQELPNIDIKYDKFKEKYAIDQYNEFFRYRQRIPGNDGFKQIDDLVGKYHAEKYKGAPSWHMLTNPKLLDNRYQGRAINGIETVYTFDEVISKKAGPGPTEYIQAYTETTALTPYNHGSRLIYLSAENNSKKSYEQILLECQKGDDGNKLYIDEYLEKSRQAIINLRYTIYEYAKVLANIKNLKITPPSDNISLVDGVLTIDSFFTYVLKEFGMIKKIT